MLTMPYNFYIQVVFIKESAERLNMAAATARSAVLFRLCDRYPPLCSAESGHTGS